MELYLIWLNNQKLYKKNDYNDSDNDNDNYDTITEIWTPVVWLSPSGQLGLTF